MTTCTKPVRRKVRCDSTLIRTDEIIVSVYPHGEIGLRELNRRTEYMLPLADAWRVAVQISVTRYNRKVAEFKKTMTLKEARRRARSETGL